MIVNTRHANYSGEVWIVEWTTKDSCGWKWITKRKEFRNGFSYAEGFARRLEKRGITVENIYREI